MALKNFLTSKFFFKQVAIVLVIIVVVVFGMMQWLSYTTNHGQEIPVPNLLKKTVEKAAEELEDADLEYIVLDTVDFRADFPPYSIVTQDPLPKATVKQNRKIYLKVNAKGYNTIEVPDLIQKTYRGAIPVLKSMGLNEGTKTYVPYLAKDVILEMKQDGRRLKAGDKVLKASKIDLVLGDGKTGYQEPDSIRDMQINTDTPKDE